jgi:hypothetical protein
MLKKRFLACLLVVSLVVTMIGINVSVSAVELGQNANILSQWNTTAGTVTQASNGISYSGSGTGMLVESFYKNAFTSVDGFNVDLNLDALGADTGSNFGLYLSTSASPSNDGIKLVFQPYASNSSLYAVYTWPYVGGVLKEVNVNYLEIMKNTGDLNVRFAKVGGVWKLYINGTDKGVDLTSISGLLDSGNLYFGLYAYADTLNSYSLRVNKINGYSAGKINVSNTSKWTTSTGTMTQNFNGLSFSGSGSGMLVESYFQEALTNVDGFNTTVNLDALGSEISTNFGLYLTSATSSASNGIKVVIAPFAANDDITACWIYPYYNNGGGSTYSAAANNYLEINKSSGSFNISLRRDTSNNWHLFVNGIDRGVDLSAIKPVLDAGNLYFGLYAYADAQNSYSIRVDQINGFATGRSTNVSEYALIKSNKPNVSVNQTATALSNGINLHGSLASAGLNFKYGYNKLFSQLNGFNTTVNVTLDGANGVNGSPGFEFGLTTSGSGINSDRLDVWDYLNSPVPGARGLGIRFNKYDTYYATSILVIGANGSFGDESDYINGNNIIIPSDSDLNISFVASSNGASHWSILANGREIISDNPGLNAEIDALSQMGASPVYSAVYDGLGTLTTATANMTIYSINSMNLSRFVTFGTFKKSAYSIYNIVPGTLVSALKSQITSVNAPGTFKNVDNQSLTDTEKLGTGTTFKIIEDGADATYIALIFGDVTGDGNISVDDLALIKTQLLNMTSLSENNNKFWAADVIRTGTITISDLLAVKKQILNIGTIIQD